MSSGPSARIARSLIEAGEGRKTIVGIGSGGLLDRPIPAPTVGGDLLPEWIAAMRELSRTNSTFYVIDPGGVGTTRVDGGDSGFARETGGMAFLNTNDLDGAADRIMRESASHYTLRVGSPPVGGTGLRELELQGVPARRHPPRAPRRPLMRVPIRGCLSSCRRARSPGEFLLQKLCS